MKAITGIIKLEDERVYLTGTRISITRKVDWSSEASRVMITETIGAFCADLIATALIMRGYKE